MTKTIQSTDPNDFDKQLNTFREANYISSYAITAYPVRHDEISAVNTDTTLARTLLLHVATIEYKEKPAPYVTPPNTF